MQTWQTLTFILMLIIAPLAVCEPSKAASGCLPDCAKDCSQKMEQAASDVASCCHSQTTAVLVAAMKEDSAQPQSFLLAVSDIPQNPSCFSSHELLSMSSKPDSDKGKNLAKLSLLRI